MGRLAAGVAHELNSPLSAISLAVEAAEFQISSSPDAAAKKLQSALQAAERAAEIIQKLLFYAGRTTGAASEVDVNSLVKEATAVHGDKVTLKLEQDLQLIWGREHEVREMVGNLIVNAFDAGGQEPVIVSTRSEQGSCIISVEDRGEGIAEKDLSRIFEPFFTTRTSARKGLGLSVCQQIAARHQGELRVRSKKGEGSVFEVWLPFERRSPA